MADKRVLVDSGATDNFMHPNFTTKMGLGMKELPTPRKIFNIDNTTNKSGKITLIPKPALNAKMPAKSEQVRGAFGFTGVRRGRSGGSRVLSRNERYKLC
jgi:hypothetical protein